ncbi:hypothetical protein O1611_g8781 [Lasiodiplodia mahajangana]|uniref:Uncharacterized protein n=1 Tax=Lasiodiplodia mahajangana TaxID=1108764 RepID=A0ACC2JBQ8_9PEZI|nr:hypothetical protein O1611_g8781 [Lasiodiplodia mahajangana]
MNPIDFTRIHLAGCVYRQPAFPALVMSTSAASSSGSPPSSPWAERFPWKDTTVTLDGITHSFLAPQNPRIEDPKYYDQKPDRTKDHDPRSNKEIDYVLRGEKLQRARLWGVQTWQLAALNRRVVLSTKGDYIVVSGAQRRSLGARVRDRLNQLRISSSAFSSSVRSRVSSTSRQQSRMPDTPPQRPRAPGMPVLRSQRLATPSYEGPDFQVYEQERIRVNETEWYPFLKKERWFDWVQFSLETGESNPNKTWSVDDAQIWDALSVSLELANRMLKALVKDQHSGAITRRSAAEMERRLTKLLSKHIWGFSIHAHAHAVTDFGFRVEGRDRPYSSITTLNIRKLEAILNPDLTLSERCMAQVDLTITIVHELMHGIWQGRARNDDDYDGNLWKRGGYLDGEGFNECGHYMENLFFGGLAELLPIFSDAEAGRPLPTLMFGFRKWPDPLERGDTPADARASFLQDGARVRVYPVSSSWPTKMLAESFWGDRNYPNKSDNFFHRSQLFASTARLTITRGRGRDLGEWTKAQVRRDPNPPDDPFHYPENDDVVGDWNDQNNLWVHIRASWYDTASGEWNRSAWSKEKLRRILSRFEDSFAQKNHLECAHISELFLAAIDWTSGHEHFAARMPNKRLLMAASLPLRSRELHRIERPGREWTIEHAPSEKASAAGHGTMIYTAPDNDKPERRSVGVSRFWQAALPGGAGEIQSFTQLDYLESLEEMMSFIMTRGALIHQAFARAIWSAKADLAEDRGNLAACYPGRGHTLRWASNWSFKFPEYDPTIIVYDTARKRWRGGDSSVTRVIESLVLYFSNL